MKHHVKKSANVQHLPQILQDFLRTFLQSLMYYIYLIRINGSLNYMCITISFIRNQFNTTFQFVAIVSERTKLETCLYGGFTRCQYLNL